MERAEGEYMSRAIELAKKGIGWVNPNPLVGAVLVKEHRIIGEGYHAKYGELHAERNALASLTESAEGADLYVTLEPCCHYGKTPPCVEAILEAKIKRVVIGSRDPNPKVAGKGVEILRRAGVEVVEDFMREECDKLNPVFFHYITTGLPYVVMKYAMTLDGKIATHTGASKWITGPGARAEVQEIRSRYKGIMVGIGTVLQDDPMLNVRIQGRRNPVRIICDSRLRLPIDSRICQTAREFPVLVACASAEREKREQLSAMGIQVVEFPDEKGQVDAKKLLQYLGKEGIDSILLEGGGTLNESALSQSLVQKVLVFVAPKIFGGRECKTPVAGVGVSTPDEAVKLKLQSMKQIEEDLLLEYEVVYEKQV